MSRWQQHNTSVILFFFLITLYTTIKIYCLFKFRRVLFGINNHTGQASIRIFIHTIRSEAVMICLVWYWIEKNKRQVQLLQISYITVTSSDYFARYIEIVIYIPNLPHWEHNKIRSVLSSIFQSKTSTTRRISLTVIWSWNLILFENDNHIKIAQGTWNDVGYHIKFNLIWDPNFIENYQM